MSAVDEKAEPVNQLEMNAEVEVLTKFIADKNWMALKNFCRMGGWKSEDPVRKCLWTNLSALYKKTLSNEDLQAVTSDLSSIDNPGSPRRLPSFVDPSFCRFYNLSASEQKNVEKVVWLIAMEHPEITFCPLLYPFAALFLHFHDVKSTFVALTYLLEAPASGLHPCNGQSLLPQTKTQVARDAYVLIKLTNRFGILPQRKFFDEQRKKLRKDNQIDVCFLEWLKWIFIGLPVDHIIRIVDCFLVEGSKFLFRIALALLLLYRRTFPSSGFIPVVGVDPGRDFNLEKMLNFCENITLLPDELIKFSLQITRLRRSKIDSEYRKADVSMKNQSLTSLASLGSPMLSSPKKRDMISFDSVKISLSSRIAPRSLTSSIMDYNLLDTLWDWLPDKVLCKEAKIIFSTNEDGNSLQTFFVKTADNEPTLLVVVTDLDEIFGAYCSSSWSLRLENDGGGASSHYFGTGETFLFTLKPKQNYYPWIGTRESAYSQPSDNLPHSSQLFMSATSKMISVGAGNGIGLWLDENLSKGTTTRCDTFANKPLCPSETFNATAVEVIGFH